MDSSLHTYATSSENVSSSTHPVAQICIDLSALALCACKEIHDDYGGVLSFDLCLPCEIRLYSGQTSREIWTSVPRQ